MRVAPWQLKYGRASATLSPFSTHRETHSRAGGIANFTGPTLHATNFSFLRSGRQHSKALCAPNPIDSEVGVIGCEYRRDVLALCQVNQCGVCEVHWPIRISKHERLDGRELRVVNGL